MLTYKRGITPIVRKLRCNMTDAERFSGQSFAASKSRGPVFIGKELLANTLWIFIARKPL